jgi:type IV secretory pathway TrbL component
MSRKRKASPLGSPAAVHAGRLRSFAASAESSAKSALNAASAGHCTMAVKDVTWGFQALGKAEAHLLSIGKSNAKAANYQLVDKAEAALNDARNRVENKCVVNKGNYALEGRRAKRRRKHR